MLRIIKYLISSCVCRGNLCIFVVAAVFCLVALVRDDCEADMRKVVSYDEISLSGILNDGSRFVLSISIEPYLNEDGSSIKKFWGRDELTPGYLIDRFYFSINGNEILIPREAISDLADINIPYGVYLMQNERNVAIYLKGGDAAGAYTAKLNVVGSNLVSRVIEYMNSDGDLDQIILEYH